MMIPSKSIMKHDVHPGEDVYVDDVLSRSITQTLSETVSRFGTQDEHRYGFWSRYDAHDSHLRSLRSASRHPPFELAGRELEESFNRSPT